MNPADCWVDIPADSPFPLHNLPFGLGRRPEGSVGAFVAIGDVAFDLAAARAHFGGTAAVDDLVDDRGTLTRFAGLGREAHRAVRTRVRELLCDDTMRPELSSALRPIHELEMLVPVAVGDYVDFYSSLHHATNLGRMFRPDGEPLLPNWRHLPVGYHGRSGTIVADRAGITRPQGLRIVDGRPMLGPTDALDIELEVGFVV